MTTTVATFELGTAEVSTSIVAAVPLGDGGRAEADDKGVVWGSTKISSRKETSGRIGEIDSSEVGETQGKYEGEEPPKEK